MAEGALVVLVLLVAAASTIGLYLLIEAETSNPTVVDRRTAEREARARGGLQRSRDGCDRDDGPPERDGDSGRSRTQRGDGEDAGSSSADAFDFDRDDR